MNDRQLSCNLLKKTYSLARLTISHLNTHSIMKTLPTILAAFAALALSAHAESTLKIEGVHNCCKKCATGIETAVSKVSGAKATIDKSTVTITAASEADAKKAAAELVAAGYYGKGAEAPAAPDSAKVKSATVENVHLCCPKCAKAANEAAKSVAGVTASKAAKGEKTFIVEGDFSKADLAAALEKSGFAPTIK